MKIRRWIALLALVALPALVLAQTVVQDGQSTRGVQQSMLGGHLVRSDSTQDANTGDGNGNLKVVDADRDRNAYRVITLLTNQLAASAAAMADSSTAQATYDLKRMGLMLRGQHDSLSTVVRVAVQIRAHMTSQQDSASTFPWYRWTFTNTTAGIIKSDSIGHGLAPTQVPVTAVQATAANSSNGGLLPGEFEVVFNVARGDSTALGNGKPFSFPNGIYIPLVGPLGEWFWAPYTSVRFRVINGVRHRFKLQAYIVGSPL